MSLEQLVFYFFAGVLLVAALMVVTVKNPVRAALFLVLGFFASAALWLLLEAEFLAITLILVYVGAVMVLFLFVVMMLDINLAILREGFARYLPLGVAVAVVMAVMMVMVVGGEPFGLEHAAAPERQGAEFSNTRLLGSVLYTDYLFAFELAAVVLLVAIIAAIALTLRHRDTTKFQEVGNQVVVSREDRVRLVKMEPEQRR
ncbi:NADH-quinone oxidoreductase subunit J [Ectothiorhodospiraceae bacterium BW-2]|nr:NADH-quinone oxidoreductase subunit J [Ectothiorhodospiraceae bacterium BW-2]